MDIKETIKAIKSDIKHRRTICEYDVLGLIKEYEKLKKEINQLKQ